MRGLKKVQRPCILLQFAILVLLSHVKPCLAELFLSAQVHSQSPDGKLLEVNGVIISSSGNVLGWIYDWGDGTRTTGFFPAVHRYTAAGTYTVTVTGYDDQGNVRAVTFK